MMTMVGGAEETVTVKVANTAGGMTPEMTVPAVTMAAETGTGVSGGGQG